MILLIDHAVVADDLARIREEVREGAADPPRTKSRKKRSSPCGTCGLHQCDCEDESFFELVFGDIIFYVVASPWWLPHAELQDDLQNVTGFPAYPYVDDLAGSLTINDFNSTPTNNWMGQFTAEYGSDFNDIERIGGRLVLDTASRWGVDTEFNSLVENLGTSHDSLWIGDVNLTYRFAQGEHVQFRTGLGMNWLADDRRTDAGFNFTYNIDIYPVRPWVLKTGIDLGTLGDTTRVHYRGTVGVQVRQVEIYTGYDYHRIGGVDLHGWISGVTLWFQ